MKLRGTSVFVTGAGGFIGSHLTERLVAEGTGVRVLVKYNSMGSCGWLEQLPKEVLENVEVVQGDIRDGDHLQKLVKGIDVIFHLAALISIPYSYHTPVAYVATNTQGTLNVLQASLREGVQRVVHTSTSEVYGTAQYIPMGEDHPLQGQSPYSASKIGADMLAESFFRSFDLPVVTVRPFNTYGPRQSIRAIVPTIITQALAGLQLRLGSLYPTRDFTYITDMVEGFVRLSICDEAVGQVVNLGNGTEISMGDLARAILDIVGHDAPIEQERERIRPEASEVDCLCARTERAQALIGWAPSIDLSEGLKSTVAWYKVHKDLFKTEIYAV